MSQVPQHDPCSTAQSEARLYVPDQEGWSAAIKRDWKKNTASPRIRAKTSITSSRPAKFTCSGGPRNIASIARCVTGC